jgi:hypothetical protein
VKPPPAPIGFLLLVVGGWIAFRVVALLPAPGGEESAAIGAEAPAIAAAPPVPRPPSAPLALEPPVVASTAGFGMPVARMHTAPLTGGRSEPAAPRVAMVGGLASPPPFLAAPSLAPSASPSAQSLALEPEIRAPASAAASPPFLAQTAAGSSRPGRWSGSAWLFLRDEGEAGLAPGSTLGGSQAGARLAYRLNGDAARPLSLSGRLYLPLGSPRGSEVAVGLDWRPVAALPINLLAERRQRLGREGRSDFSLTIYGGGERRVLGGRVRVEAYGQAGVVGVEERDLFADGAVRASVVAGHLELGAGAWGGAQPGASRLDIGPQASVRLPVGRSSIRVSAEYRFRVAGDAAPASGPALTIAADF